MKIVIREALFSDQTEEFLSPAEPKPFEKISIRFRTAVNNADNIYLCISDREILMQKISKYGALDYYEVEIDLFDTPVHYFFKIVLGNEVWFYDKLGPSKFVTNEFDFTIIPGFKTPDWAKGAVMYQILVDRFFNGDTSNDVLTDEYNYQDKNSQKVHDWNRPPGEMDIRDFYGGDIKGVMDKLDYLSYLGIEAIYFNPLFVSPSSHKYDIQDYDYIDPHIGVIKIEKGDLLDPNSNDNTQASLFINRVSNPENLIASNELFAQFCEEAHKRGIKIILDGVFNHCGSFNKWLDGAKIYSNKEEYKPGALWDEKSPYRDYFNFTSQYEYEGWWGHISLPKLNYETSENLLEEIMKIAENWLKPPYSIDGWRLDVAADIGHSEEFNHNFFRELRKRVKAINPEALILAEHYGDPSAWLNGDQWDTVMNYDAFMEPLSWFLTGMEKHSDAKKENLTGDSETFFSSMAFHMSKLHLPAMLTAMNQISNHDHSRFLTRTNGKVGRISTLASDAAVENTNKDILREAVVIQMTWPGSPTIYYGDEAGLTGFTDPDNRRTYPWGNEDIELIEFHREIIAIHKKNPSLQKGSIKMLYKDYNILSYGRFLKDNIIVVAINNNDESKEIEIPVWHLGATDSDKFVNLIRTSKNSYNVGSKVYDISDGKLNLELPAFGAAILKIKR